MLSELRTIRWTRAMALSLVAIGSLCFALGKDLREQREAIRAQAARHADARGERGDRDRPRPRGAGRLRRARRRVGLPIGTAHVPFAARLLREVTRDVRLAGSCRTGDLRQWRRGPFSLYADAYQEKMSFIEGRGKRNSTRTGVTVGVAFHP